MTDYDKLESGRELDKLIAEMVCQKVPCDKWQRNDRNSFMMDMPRTCGHSDCYPKGHPAHYSRNWAAAGTIVDLFQDRDGITVSMSTFPLKDDNGFGAAASFHRQDSLLVTSHAETIQLAICRAALKAAKGLWRSWTD